MSLWHIMSICSSVQQVMTQREAPWLSDLAAGLHDILSSKISQPFSAISLSVCSLLVISCPAGSVMRASALLLSAQLCQSYGVEWTLTSGDNKLFRLLANLAAIVGSY